MSTWDVDHDFVQKLLPAKVCDVSCLLYYRTWNRTAWSHLKKNYEIPHARPVLIQGSDGDDIYFHYIRNTAPDGDAERRLIERGFGNRRRTCQPRKGVSFNEVRLPRGLG